MYNRTSVLELRAYTLHPGRRDELIELFERAFVEPQEALGITLPGLFRDAERPDRFVWLRGFADMVQRKRALEAFYGGPVWREHRDAANATMIDSDNVLLLRPHEEHAGRLDSMRVRGPLFAATYLFTDARARDAFADSFSQEMRAATIATFVTENSPNTFMRLPVREGLNAFVALLGGISRAQVLARERPADELTGLLPTSRSRLQLSPMCVSHFPQEASPPIP